MMKSVETEFSDSWKVFAGKMHLMNWLWVSSLPLHLFAVGYRVLAVAVLTSSVRPILIELIWMVKLK